MVAFSEAVEDSLADRLECVAVRVGKQAVVSDIERESLVAAFEDLPGGVDEGVVAAAAEQVKRGYPVGRGDVLDTLTAGFPVAGALVMDALDEVVADDEIWQDGRRLVAQERGEVVEVENFRQGPPVPDGSHDNVMEVAKCCLEGWEGLDVNNWVSGGCCGSAGAG